MRFSRFICDPVRLCGMVLLLAAAMSPKMATAQGPAEIPIPKSSQDWSRPLGIAAKKPVYAGGCKACPYGEVGLITREALSYYGYDVHLCFTCASSLAARDMSLKETAQQGGGDPFSPPAG